MEIVFPWIQQNIGRWTLLAVLCADAVLSAGGAMAQQTDAVAPPQDQSRTEYRRLVEDMALSAERVETLASEIQGIRKDRATISAALIQSAKTEKKLSEDSDEISARLDELGLSRETLIKSLEVRRGLLAEVLGALQRMGLHPPPAILVKPEDALSSVRSAILLGAVVPELRGETEILIADLRELSSIGASIEGERVQLSAAVREQLGEKTRLDLLLEVQKSLQGRTEAALEGERRKSADLAEKARSLKELIASMEKLAAENRRAAEAAARTREAESKRDAMLAALPVPDANRLVATTPLSALLGTRPTPAVDAAMAATGPDTITKFLFTSGSTKLPKAVVNTHRMWCANQQQMRQSMPVLTEEPPVLVDWLPWNHTFGGNHNVGLVIYNGGTLYIDDGKPTPALMGETLRNLREVAPTLYFNVPTGFEAIAHAMKSDDALRRNLLSRVRMFFYAGAALAQPIWDALHECQEREIGERIVMGTGLGMTESAPFAVFVTGPDVKAGHIGVPTPGLELKLVPAQGKTEVRYKGPNITPGYWRNEEATRECLDEEGFFCTGDAVQWIDACNLHQGLKFDGRIAEDFKLATGTFVSVGPLRAKIIAAGAPYVQDAVITGLNLNEVGALLFPTQAVRQLASLPADAPMQQVIESASVQAQLQKVANALAAEATGSASRVARLHFMAEPPSIDKGEVTDKGSINQRAVLSHRAALVDALHDGSLPFTVQPRKAAP